MTREISHIRFPHPPRIIVAFQASSLRNLLSQVNLDSLDSLYPRIHTWAIFDATMNMNSHCAPAIPILPTLFFPLSRKHTAKSSCHKLCFRIASCPSLKARGNTAP
jgi:hypothetical protein